MTENDQLNLSVKRGALISYAGFLAGKIIVFANTVVLARLLAPEDFGLVAIGLLVISFNEALTEAGTGAAVVWSRGPWELTAAVALSLAIIGGLVMAVVIFFAAPAIAGFFNEPDVTPVIRVFAFCLVLSSPAAVFAGILQRNMEFGRRVIPELARSVAKGAVGIPLALAGYGVWSLVSGQLVATMIGLLLVIVLSGWRPRLSLDRATVAAILPYIAQIAAIGLLGLAIKRVDVAIIGHRLETEVLGYYTLAFTLTELVVLGICWSVSQSLFPALSQNAEDGGRMKQVFARGLSTLLLVTTPIAVGIAVVAEPMILAVFGQKWEAAIPLVQLLALYALIYSCSFNLGDLYKAAGRPKILIWISVVNLALAVPILMIAANWGVTGVAAGQVVVGLAIGVVNWVVARRLEGIGTGTLVTSLRVPLIAAGTAAICAIAARSYVASGASNLMQFLTMACAGLLTYAISLAALMPQRWLNRAGQS